MLPRTELAHKSAWRRVAANCSACSEHRRAVALHRGYQRNRFRWQFPYEEVGMKNPEPRGNRRVGRPNLRFSLRPPRPFAACENSPGLAISGVKGDHEVVHAVHGLEVERCRILLRRTRPWA